MLQYASIFLACTISFTQDVVDEEVELTIEQEVQACIKFFSTVPNPEDVRMISFRAVPPKIRDIRVKTTKFWLNNMTFEPAVEEIRPVPGTKDITYWFYLRDFGWSAAAWQACADRDPYWTEPSIPSELAQEGRKWICAELTKAASAQFIMRADLLFRQTVETDISPSYYDLLFAKQRFAAASTIKKTIYHPGGNYRYPNGTVIKDVERGHYAVEFPGPVKFKDFPADLKEWDAAFGLDKFEEFYKLTNINVKRGAVVDEGISIVANANRLIERARGPIGSRYTTFDVKQTSGKRDFVENLHYGFEFDAGEHIVQLPNGGQAYLLSLATGKRIEFADNKVAKDTTDPRDPRVRNPGSCVVCHEKGIIEPLNAVEENLKAGIDIYFKDKRKARDTRAFFLGWQKELTGDQDRYVDFVKRTSGFAPAENSAKFKEYRDWIDSSLNLEQAAREVGVSKEKFKLIASKSPRVRLLQLVEGLNIPRATWQGDNIDNRGMFYEFMLLYRSYKK